MLANDQIWRVAIPFLKSRKVVKLPNPHNSIHNALRYANLSPERKKYLEAQKKQNGQIHGRIALKSQVGSLAIRYIACYALLLFSTIDRSSSKVPHLFS